MRPISKKNREEIDRNDYFRYCARAGPDCDGRITIEHAFIYAGRQIDRVWAFVPLCWHHHLGVGLDKELNQAIALLNATDEDLLEYPRTDWVQMKRYLFGKYGLKG